MKKLLTLLFCMAACLTTMAENNHTPRTIVVQPGESLHDALRQAREWRRTQDACCQGGITIRIKAGRYRMQEPLFLRPEDSGTADSPTIIVGEEGAVICGDSRQQHTQVWPKEGMERILAFDTKTRTITIPAFDSLWVPPPHLEMVVHQRWAIAILRVKEMKQKDGKIVVSFMEPESRLEFEHPWPQPVIDGERGNSSFLLRTTEQRDGIEQLVIVDGANHISFQGLTLSTPAGTVRYTRGMSPSRVAFP